jgi:hypothetical protein
MPNNFTHPHLPGAHITGYINRTYAKLSQQAMPTKTVRFCHSVVSGSQFSGADQTSRLHCAVAWAQILPSVSTTKLHDIAGWICASPYRNLFLEV